MLLLGVLAACTPTKGVQTAECQLSADRTLPTGSATRVRWHIEGCMKTHGYVLAQWTGPECGDPYVRAYRSSCYRRQNWQEWWAEL